MAATVQSFIDQLTLNPSPEVRELAMTHLREFAAAGDPFSLAILEGRELP